MFPLAAIAVIIAAVRPLDRFVAGAARSTLFVFAPAEGTVCSFSPTTEVAVCGCFPPTEGTVCGFLPLGVSLATELTTGLPAPGRDSSTEHGVSSSAAGETVVPTGASRFSRASILRSFAAQTLRSSSSSDSSFWQRDACSCETKCGSPSSQDRMVKMYGVAKRGTFGTVPVVGIRRSVDGVWSDSRLHPILAHC